MPLVSRPRVYSGGRDSEKQESKELDSEELGSDELDSEELGSDELNSDGLGFEELNPVEPELPLVSRHHVHSRDLGSEETD